MISIQTLAVLNPVARIDQHIMDDSDLAGPFLFCALFGTFLLLVSPLRIYSSRSTLILTTHQSGKLWFGYVCGLAILGAISLNFVFSMMSPALTREEVNQAQQDAHGGYGSHLSSTLTIGRSSSVLGYCLLPLVFASLIGVLLPLDSLFGYCLVSLAIAWCTYSSSGMFCSVG